jgi:ferrous iron transport protein A
LSVWVSFLGGLARRRGRVRSTLADPRGAWPGLELSAVPARQGEPSASPSSGDAAASGKPATLGELVAGQTGRVLDVLGGAQVVSRLAALGFVPGTPVAMVQNFGRGPVIVELRGTRVALGRREAGRVHLIRSQ